jgi:hypothetical protein
MKVDEVVPNVETDALLAGAQFADAFRIVVAGSKLDARQAAQRMMGRSPRWVERLLTLRHVLVAPFGLKTSGAGEAAAKDSIGIFPVLSETPDRLVAGFDDSHLDFRVVVDVSACDDGQQVTATTLVRTNNWLGRGYLRVILPFHRLVVRALLRQVAG